MEPQRDSCGDWRSRGAKSQVISMCAVMARCWLLGGAARFAATAPSLMIVVAQGDIDSWLT
jgi:hypothetical protein